MRPSLNLVVSAILGLVSALMADSPGGSGPLANDPLWLPAVPDAIAAVGTKYAERFAAGPAFHFEPIGLSMVHPYARGKVPVVFIHGLGGTPESWARMIDWLEANPIIRDHYQLWTFGYATGEPILYSASLLRQSLHRARTQYDPAKTDAAFDRMVLIGYSMGGILAKVMAEDSRSVLWEKISSQPVEELVGPAESREVLRRAFIFNAEPEVRRVVFIATPHRGSRVDQRAIHWLGSWLNQPLDSLRKVHQSLLDSNQPGFFRKSFRQSLPSSVDQLAWEHPTLMSLFDLHVDSRVTFHSIIADVNDPPVAGGTDGFVPYASSHIDGASSELIVSSGHLCQANPLVIGECERILMENLATTERRPNLPGAATAEKKSLPISGQHLNLGRPAGPAPEPSLAVGGSGDHAG
jgi:pimeloyl-ACP methyl ester carboxylesterase